MKVDGCCKAISASQRTLSSLESCNLTLQPNWTADNTISHVLDDDDFVVTTTSHLLLLPHRVQQKKVHLNIIYTPVVDVLEHEVFRSGGKVVETHLSCFEQFMASFAIISKCEVNEKIH
uniref:Uncharacterized protein n=1 Tax=Glossina austeni TaxID=7395 RepID=A0A1A9VFS1_GLOAU